MNGQTLLFDLDDTLIHCNKYFVIVLDDFAEQMQEWFAAHAIPKQRFIAKQLELDIIGVKKYGFVPHRFPESLVETYDFFCQETGRKPSNKEREHLIQLGYSVYDFQHEPYPFMEETLQKLTQQGHDLYLYTGGDPEIQLTKVRKLNLDFFFEDRIYVARHKTTEAMEGLLHKWKLQRQNTWMIGNSVTTDIVPALHAQIHAIYIPAETEWKYNKGEINVIPTGEFFQLTSLKEVPEVLARFQ